MPASFDEFLALRGNATYDSSNGGAPSSFQAFRDEQLRQASIIPPKPPANWFGEATAGVARGTTELKQMFQGAGALGASFLGAEDTKDWFIKGYLGSEQELQDNPASVPSYKDINSFGSLVRYAIASVGEISPMIAESLVTGGIGSLAALSETATGAVAKQAVGKLLSTESKAIIAPAIRTELSSYLEGGLAREALSPAAQELATPAAKLMASRWGSNGAIAGSSIAKEGGGIYGDLLADPNVSESDRRIAGLVGGIIAAIPDTFVQGWIVDKFLHGTVKEPVTKTVKAGIMGYLTRFAAEAAPEMVKTFGAEGGQEVVQTIVELASKNWADPAHRYDFLNFSPQQWDEVIDSGLKGGLGGAGVAIPMTTVMSMRTAHPDPKVREGMKDTLSKADDFKLPSAEVTPEHTELSNLEDQILAKQTAINQNPEAAPAIQAELAPLQARAKELSAKLFPKLDLQEGVKAKETTATEPTSLVNDKLTETEQRELDARAFLDQVPKDAMIRAENGVVYSRDEKGVFRDVYGDELNSAIGVEVVTQQNKTNPTVDDWKGALKSVPRVKVNPNDPANRLTKPDVLTVDVRTATAGTRVVLPDGNAGTLTDRALDPKMNSREVVLDNGTTTEIAPAFGSVYDEKDLSRYLPVKNTELSTENQPSPLPTADEQLIESTRAFYAQEMGTQREYTPVSTEQTQQVLNKRAEVDAHIDSIAAGNTEYATQLKAAITPDMVAMFAKEGVALVTRGEDQGYHARLFNGKLELQIPRGSEKEANISRVVPSEAITHEVIHLGDLVALRDEWNSGDKSEGLGSFIDRRTRERGAILREAQSSLPGIFHEAYRFGKAGQLSDLRLGQEIPRMMAELARTGKLTEATDALSRAAQSNNKLDAFLKTWIDSLRKAGEWLKRFLNPSTSNPELLKAFDNINRVLDKYGVLVNQNRPIAQPVQSFSVGEVVDYKGSQNKQAVEQIRSENEVIIRDQVTGKTTLVHPRFLSKSNEQPQNVSRGDISRPSVAPATASVRNPVSESLAKPAKPTNPRQAFLAAAKTGNQADTVNRWLDWRRTKNDVPTTKSELATSLVDLNARLKTPISQKDFNKIVKERNQQGSTVSREVVAPQRVNLPEVGERVKVRLSHGDDEGTVYDIRPDKGTVTIETSPGQLHVVKLDALKQYEQATKATSQPAQKASGITESPEEGLGGSIQSEPGRSTRYNHPIIASLAEKIAGATNRLEAIRIYIAENHPLLTPHLESIVQQVQSNEPTRVEVVALRGQEVADAIRQYKYGMFIHDNIGELSKQLGQERGIEVVGMQDELPDDTYIIDTTGDLADYVLTDEASSIIHPVELTDKLKEAQLTKGIPETHGLEVLGFHTIDDNSNAVFDEHFAVFDEHFGENNWIIKSFTRFASKSFGVFFADAVKRNLSQDPEAYARVQTHELMVQKLHDVVESDRASNEKILKDREIRVHVITDKQGEAHILPLSTFWKLSREESQGVNVADMTPLVVEDDSIKLAHQQALEAIRSLPESDRTGQFYGMDLVKLRNNQDWGVVENNPTDVNGASGYAVMNPLVHESYMAALMGEQPLHAELAQLIHEAQALVNQSSTPAHKPSYIAIDGGERDFEVTPEVHQYFVERHELLAEISGERSYSRTTMQQYLDAKKAWHDVEGRIREFGEEFGAVQEVGPAGALPRMAGGIGLISGVSSEEAESELRGYKQLKMNFDTAFEIDKEQRQLVDSLDRRLSEMDRSAMSRFGLSQDNLGYILESRQYENALVNQSEDSSTPARKPTFTPVVERQLDQLQEQANTALNRDLEATLKEGNPETKLRGNRPDIVGYTATDLDYQVEHQFEPIGSAADIISKHGLWKVLDAFIEQSHAAIVRRFNIEERDGISGEADTVMAALRQQVIAQLHHIIETLTTENDSRTRKARSWLQEQFEAMEKLNAERGTIAGRVSSLSGKVFKIVNGARAARDYFEAGSSHLLKVLGVKAQPFVDGTFSQEVNALRAKYMSSVMNSSQMLALLGELNKRIHTKQYQKDARATLAANEQQLRNTTKSTAAKAAEHVSMDELGEQWANEASARMVKMMNGLPRGAEKLTELQLFNRTVAQIVRENADQIGLIGPLAKGESAQQRIAKQFAVVINNEGLYREFTNTLTNKIFSEYKPEPGSEFAKQVVDFRDQMANHLWRDGLVTSLVNEKLKQYQTTLSEIVKKHIKETNGQNFKETHELAERMRDDVRTMMEAEGVQNEGLLNRMVDEVEANLLAQIEQKRLDFLGSAAGGREFLRHMQTTIGNKAKEHALSKTSLFGELHSWLSDDLGIPDDMAQALSNVMDQQLGRDIAAEREAIVRRRIEALKTTLPPKQHKQVDMAMKKLLTAVNLGVMRDEEAYSAFAGPLGLPPWNAEVAAQADKLGAQIATASKYNRPIYEKQLSDLMEAQKGINPYDMGIAAMYANMLAGPSTHLVNIISTAGSITGHAAVAIIRNPQNTPHILSAMWRAALGEAQVEMREAFWNGHTFSKEGKYWHNLNPLEIANPIFKSKDTNATRAHIVETAAEVVHKLYSAVGAKYVGRALVAADVFFYKVAQEAGFAAKVGDRSLVDQNIIETARTLARREVQDRGINPDENRHTRRQTESLAYRILNDLRLKSTTNPTMVDDNLREAWLSSGNEAVDATFNGDPKGLLGKLSKLIEKWTATDEQGQVNPIGKMLVPFTKVSANVTNQMVEWTPFGLVRFGLGGHDFLVKDVEGNLIRNKDIAVRAILGTGAMIIMASILSKQDEDDPWLALFANGPRDAEARRQMLDRGWKPNTLKVGNYYLSYMSTPLAMPFAILGRMMDDHRDGKAYDPLSFSAASVAMLQTVTSQSFLASIHDVMAAVDSPTPEKNASRIFSRLAIGITPLIGSNLVQQIDKWVAPSIQQADGFWESYLKNLPVVRGLALQPMLNVFGEPVHRTPGLGFIPGLERFITMERGDDPIYNVLGQKRIRVPGFSKTSKLGDEVMTHEQYYEYVQTAGPLVKQALEADLPQLRQMTRENAQEHVDKVTRDIKQRIRQQMKSSLVN